MYVCAILGNQEKKRKKRALQPETNKKQFAVSYSLPYLMDAGYADLGSKVGFIYGSIAGAVVFWAVFFLPELRKRSLEEVEEMWEAKVPAWRMRSYQSTSTTGAGARITQLENHTGHTKMTTIPDIKADVDAQAQEIEHA